MIKRTNKITALLVAAAYAMASMPAVAADNAKEGKKGATGTTTATAADKMLRLGVKDGTVESGIAYKDGKYVYLGYRTDTDYTGIYYNSGTDEKFIEETEYANINDSNDKGVYGSNYVFAVDEHNQYLIDLINGEKIEETPEYITDNLAVKLKNNLKKTERYGKLIDVNSKDNLGYDDTDAEKVITGVIQGAKFGNGNWYRYSVQPISTNADTVNNLVNNKLYGFTNEAGKYIDTSNIANIYAYSTLKGETVKIEEFSNNANDVNEHSGLLATLRAIQPLTQDKDYIYAKVTVNITDVAANATPTATTVAAASANITNLTGTSTITKHVYIQKISKEQGEKKDGAYLPKSVQSYELLDSSNKIDSSKAAGIINDAEASSGKIKYSAVNGQLLAIKNTGTNVLVTVIKLVKSKVDFTIDVVGKDDSKIDVYLAKKSDKDKDDIDIENLAAVDVDVDGNVWAISKGKIYEFQKNEFKEVYTTDRALDSLSIYDAKNLIAWEDDGDSYTTYSEGIEQTKKDASEIIQTKTESSEINQTTKAQVGWIKLADGIWNYYDATGAKLINKWVNFEGKWYFLKEDGVMVTGWYNYNGIWYLLDDSGAMVTGWAYNNGNWYYLNTNGSMATNTTIDGYILDASGVMI